MDLSDFRTLLTPAGQEALKAAETLAPREVDYLRHFQDLSRRFPTKLARAALETAILRAEAVKKFPYQPHLYFTRAALEQASSFEVSVYRAGRFQGLTVLADLGCSVGGDTLMLAQVAPTVGLDKDPLRLAMAAANLAGMASAQHWDLIHADLRDPLPFTAGSDWGLFFDPGRREGARRAFSVERYQPPLSVVRRWLPDFPAIGVKISPGVKWAELGGYDAEVEFISLRGGLKEAVLWFGPLKMGRRTATVLPGPHTLTSTSVERADRLPVSEPQSYLYEPDPAVIRAGLVFELGVRLGASQLDPDIAYLTALQLVSTPFARAWQVEAWFPFGLKRLRTYLREREVGRVVVKKRGSPLEPEALIPRLRLRGEGERVVFLTHLQGRPIVIIAFAR